MANIVETEFQVFVTYEIDPIPHEFEDSLYRHLLTKVWGKSNWADEDIRVVVNLIDGKVMINQVRYQFGDRYDEILAEEIGDLIDEQIDIWMSRNSHQ
jgi:hypothetical protein